MSQVHIVFTEDRVLISKKAYASWRDIQTEYDDYKTSLGPWNTTTAASWLDEEYGDLDPSAAEQVAALLSGDPQARTVLFRAP